MSFVLFGLPLGYSENESQPMRLPQLLSSAEEAWEKASELMRSMPELECITIHEMSELGMIECAEAVCWPVGLEIL